MFRLDKEKTLSTPYVLIDEAKGYMKLSGESFPENIYVFYGEIIQWLPTFLHSNFAEFTLDMEMTYFNSSTSKLFLNIFEMLDAARAEGKNVRINWIANADNEIILECGEEYQEDFPDLNINIISTPQ